MSSRDRKRFPRITILKTYNAILEDIAPLIRRYAFVGSYRRGSPDCKDADLLVIPNGPFASEVLGSLLLRMSDRKSYMGGDDFAYFRFDGVPVNVFVTTDECWGAALQYTTGSREHNIAVRAYAKRRGLMANQFGVFHRGKKLPGSSETENGFYAALGLRWVRPPNRCRSEEGNGVIPLTLHPFDRDAALVNAVGQRSARPHRAVRTTVKEVRW